jgi:hypothetical protein
MPPRKQQQRNLIRVRVGLFGYKMMTPRQFERWQREQDKERERKARNKKIGRNPPRKKKQENWIIPGILKW